MFAFPVDFSRISNGEIVGLSTSLAREHYDLTSIDLYSSRKRLLLFFTTFKDGRAVARAQSWKKREQKFGKSTDEKEAGKG